MNYNLELQKVVDVIQKDSLSRVVLQLPHGLKPKAKEIQDTIRKQTNAKVFVWLLGGYGACDTPLGLEKLGIDMIIQWGHSPYKK